MDERIEKLRVDYDLDPKDFWELPQKRGTWMILHKAIEVIAAKAGVIFDMPTILDSDSANGRTALIVRGSLGERSEWSIGECNPKNNRNSYPWAMSEKRAKDRVVLKLVGLHGLVYSEDEMSGDERREEPSEPFEPVTYPNPPTRPSGLPQAGYRKDGARTPHSLNKSEVWQNEFMRELNEVQTLPMLEKFRWTWSKKAEADRWPEEWKELAVEEIRKHKVFLMQPVNDDDSFPGDRR